MITYVEKSVQEENRKCFSKKGMQEMLKRAFECDYDGDAIILVKSAGFP